jgi:DNA repair exonuclease SbcCD ATPase subunit
VHCSFQGLCADTLLKRDSTPTESGSTQKEPEENIETAENSDIFDKLQKNKQEFYDKIEEFAANLTALKEQGTDYLQTLRDNKQELSDRILEIAVNLTNLKQQNSKLLTKLQDEKQKFEDKIKEIVTKQGSLDKINISIPVEGTSEFVVKLKQVKQRLDNSLNKLKSEAQQKIQELKDNIQIEEEQQDGVSKRDANAPLAGDSVISVLLNVPTSLASAFQEKFSEFQEDASQIFKNFVASLGSSLDTLENLQNVVNASVLANVTNISEVASAAASCFEAQEATVESLVKETGESLHLKIQVASQATGRLWNILSKQNI